jgi:hypothetical protein
MIVRSRLPVLPTDADSLPPEQAQEFEEIATMDYPFEGIPTIPPRKDMDRMVRHSGTLNGLLYCP